MSVVALIHTGLVVVAPIADKVRQQIPGVEVVNYLDDRIVADLQNPSRAPGVPERIACLATAARLAGATMSMLTCSSISNVAAYAQQRSGLPVLRIDEAMADQAVIEGSRIAVVATLETTCAPTVNLLRERAKVAGTTPSISEEVVEGAFAAVAAGDRPRHDALVAEAIERAAAHSDVVVLAQASMASAAETVAVSVPVLSSVDLGVARLAEKLDAAALPI